MTKPSTFGARVVGASDPLVCVVCGAASIDGWFNNVRLCVACSDGYLKSPEKSDMSLGAQQAFAMWRDRTGTGNQGHTNERT